MNPNLGVVVSDVEARSPFQELLEPVRHHPIPLNHPSEVGLGASDHGVETPGGVGAPRQLRTDLELVGNRCGDQVDRSANRARPVLDLTRPLADLYAVHPPDDREVIGRWRGIGSGRNENPILHEGDLGGALRSGPAQADVGP